MKPWIVLLAIVAALAACAVPRQLPSGASEADVLRQFGTPTGRHLLAGGATRLEFATGPFGRDTWMVDLDAQGRVREWHNALDEPRLHALMQRLAREPREALGRAELLRTLGRPGERAGAGWAGAGAELWSWRYPTNDCLWFQATLNGDGTVRDAGFNLDPRCDSKGDRD